MISCCSKKNLNTFIFCDIVGSFISLPHFNQNKIWSELITQNPYKSYHVSHPLPLKEKSLGSLEESLKIIFWSRGSYVMPISDSGYLKLKKSFRYTFLAFGKAFAVAWCVVVDVVVVVIVLLVLDLDVEWLTKVAVEGRVLPVLFTAGRDDQSICWLMAVYILFTIKISSLCNKN